MSFRLTLGVVKPRRRGWASGLLSTNTVGRMVDARVLSWGDRERREGGRWKSALSAPAGREDRGELMLRLERLGDEVYVGR